MTLPASQSAREPDRQQVIALIRAEGGQTWQKTIIAETGWSEAKVSEVVGDLVAAGEVHKIRIGRQNRLSIDGPPDLVLP